MATSSRSGQPGIKKRQRVRLRTHAAAILVMALVGVMAVVTVRSHQGIPTREDSASDLLSMVGGAQIEVASKQRKVADLTAEIADLTTAAGSNNSATDSIQRRVSSAGRAVGTTAVRGKALVVSLDDSGDKHASADSRPDDLVVHQQDVQAVTNAMWAAGAQGITVMDHRLISTSAVRCVGNTIIVDGQVYSPPFVIVAVGDVDHMESVLMGSPNFQVFLLAAKKYGLRYTIEKPGERTLPAYQGSTQLHYASESSAT